MLLSKKQDVLIAVPQSYCQKQILLGKAVILKSNRIKEENS